MFSGTPRDGHGHHQYVRRARARGVRRGGGHGALPARRRSAGSRRGRRRSSIARAAQPAAATLTLQRRRIRSAARRDVRGDRDGEPVAASVAGAGRAAAARAALGLREARGVARIRCRPAPRSGCSTGSIRLGAVQGRCGSPTRCARRSTRCRVAERLVACRRSISTIRRRWSRRSRAYVRVASRARAGVACTTAHANGTQPACSGAMGDLALALATTRASRVARTARRRGRDSRGDRAARAGRRARHAAGHGTVYNQGRRRSCSRTRRSSMQPGHARRSRRRSLPGQRRAQDRSCTERAPIRRVRGGSRARDQRRHVHAAAAREMIIGEDRLCRLRRATRCIAHRRCPFPIRAGPIVYRFADRGARRGASSGRDGAGDHRAASSTRWSTRAPTRRSIAMMRVHVHSAASVAAGRRRVARAAEGADGRSATRRVTLKPFGDATSVFRVQGQLAAGPRFDRATATSHGESFTLGFVPIEYEHIRPLRVLSAGDRADRSGERDVRQFARSATSAASATT